MPMVSSLQYKGIRLNLEAGKKNTVLSIWFFVDQIEDGAFQFQGEGLRNLPVFKVFAQIYGLFQRVEAYLTGLAGPDMRLDVLAGGGVQFPVDIFGKPFEQGHAVLMGMVRVSPFHNTFSMLP